MKPKPIKLPGLTLDFIYEQQRCEEPVKDQPAGWRARRGYGGNCQRHAVYNVNGKRLCRIHAGSEVLDMLLKDHATHYYVRSNTPRLQRKP